MNRRPTKPLKISSLEQNQDGAGTQTRLTGAVRNSYFRASALAEVTTTRDTSFVEVPLRHGKGRLTGPDAPVSVRVDSFQQCKLGRR
jgi:hypothetical protein